MSLTTKCCLNCMGYNDTDYSSYCHFCEDEIEQNREMLLSLKAYRENIYFLRKLVNEIGLEKIEENKELQQIIEEKKHFIGRLHIKLFRAGFVGELIDSAIFIVDCYIKDWEYRMQEKKIN